MTLRPRSLALVVWLASCGGSSSTAPATTAPEATGTRPVRVDAPDDQPTGAPRPIRVEATAPGEASESDDVASPPAVEAPTGP